LFVPDKFIASVFLREMCSARKSLTCLLNSLGCISAPVALPKPGCFSNVAAPGKDSSVQDAMYRVLILLVIVSPTRCEMFTTICGSTSSWLVGAVLEGLL
jgi:hypothetical protein